MNQSTFLLSQKNNVGNEKDFENKKPKTLGIVSDIYSSYGAPWEVYHKANRTDKDIPISFQNNSYDIAEMPLGGSWEGYSVNSTVFETYDSRNWCNGTFTYGNDDDNSSSIDDDTSFIYNNFQNWTFNKKDIIPGSGPFQFQNNMSGNYFDTSNGDNRDCLELRLDSNRYWSNPRWWNGYNKGDKCWWNTSLVIPRGRLIDSRVEYEINPKHLANFNSWRFQILINNVSIYSIGTYTLKQYGNGTWHTFSIPQEVWQNTTNIFSDLLNNSIVDISLGLEYFAEDASYSEREDTKYEQILIDNIKFIAKTEVKPEQIHLKINQTEVKNVNWAEGYSTINGKWQAEKLTFNYSCEDSWKLSNYEISLKTNINLFSNKSNPKTLYETNYNSVGTFYTVQNNSIVNWECFVYFSVLNGYQETEMKLKFPSDINITWISEPQNPSINKLYLCDNFTPGLLKVPVKNLTLTPNGYWNLKAISPNYCSELAIYKNSSNNNWALNKTFTSGDYINITAKILDSPLILNYKEETKAYLFIWFPNGSFWQDKKLQTNLDAIGNLYFESFQIPSNPPNYEVGQYKIIVTWNNSYSNYGLNETGIIMSSFIVVHQSNLEPDQGKYYIEGSYSVNLINIKVLYFDKQNRKAIEEGIVYTFLGINKRFFSEISPGLYLLELETSSLNAGNNTITIYANSSFYTNNLVNITIKALKQSILSVSANFLSIPIGEILNITATYTDKNSDPIDDALINLIGEGLNVELIQNTYNKIYLISFDTSNLDIGTQLFSIHANKTDYDSKISSIKVDIRRIETKLETEKDNSIIKIKPGEDAILRIVFKNLDFGESIKAAKLSYLWDLDENPKDLKETEKNGVYEAVIENVPEGSYTVTIKAYKSDDFEYSTIEITLIVGYTDEEIRLIQISAILTIFTAIFLTGYVLTYQKYLKYPKIVRKIKKFKKRITKPKKLAKLQIATREDSFKNLFDQELGYLSRSVKKGSPNFEKKSDKFKESKDQNKGGIAR